MLTTVLGVDFVQEKFLGQGAQDNENAIEQAKDEQISDFIRGKYKETTGSDVPIADKVREHACLRRKLLFANVCLPSKCNQSPSCGPLLLLCSSIVL